MLRQLRQHYFSARHLASAASSAILLLGLCSCQTAGMSDITGALGEKTEASRAADPRHDLEAQRDRFRANPGDAEAALQYGKALRGYDPVSGKFRNAKASDSPSRWRTVATLRSARRV